MEICVFIMMLYVESNYFLNKWKYMRQDLFVCIVMNLYLTTMTADINERNKTRI